MAQEDTASDAPIATTQEAPAPAATQPQQSRFVPLALGGALATALGFFAAQSENVERVLGLTPPDTGLEDLISDQAKQISDQSKLIESQSGKIAALQDRLNALPEPAPETDLSGLENVMVVLDGRIAALERRPAPEGLSDAAVAAYEAELATLQGSVEAQKEEIQALLNDTRASHSDAERQAQVALARAAMTRIIAAVESGAPYAEAVGDLEKAGNTVVPPALADLAAEGVPTLAQLQSEFPEVARAALAASRAEEAASGNGGLGSFLQRQLGARSVTPQEGDDADAVLSRAEAAVREGRLGDSLAELSTLSDLSRATMADWISKAEVRHAASSAANDLMTALSAN